MLTFMKLWISWEQSIDERRSNGWMNKTRGVCVLSQSEMGSIVFASFYLFCLLHATSALPLCTDSSGSLSFLQIYLFSFVLLLLIFFYWIPRWVLLLLCAGAPFTAKSPLTFCSYNGTVCCDAKEDLGLGKRFRDMNVSDPACGSLLKSILCAVIVGYKIVD